LLIPLDSLDSDSVSHQWSAIHNETACCHFPIEDMTCFTTDCDEWNLPGRIVMQYKFDMTSVDVSQIKLYHEFINAMPIAVCAVSSGYQVYPIVEPPV